MGKGFAQLMLRGEVRFVVAGDKCCSVDAAGWSVVELIRGEVWFVAVG